MAHSLRSFARAPTSLASPATEGHAEGRAPAAARRERASDARERGVPRAPSKGSSPADLPGAAFSLLADAEDEINDVLERHRGDLNQPSPLTSDGRSMSGLSVVGDAARRQSRIPPVTGAQRSTRRSGRVWGTVYFRAVPRPASRQVLMAGDPT